MNLEYDIIYSERRTIGITVERDRRVVVRAPQSAHPDVVAAAVEQKRFWIWDKLRDPRKYPVPRPRKEFVPGETFLFLGQGITLEMVDKPGSNVRLVGRTLELSREDARTARDLLVGWYVDQAKAEIAPRVANIAKAMGVPFKRVGIRKMSFRWGSCSPRGALTFNWRIVQAPMVVVDYLIAHELAHVLEANHSPEFWNIVAVHAPAWHRARDWLKTHGARLEW